MNNSELEPMTGEKLIESLDEAQRRVERGIVPPPDYEEKDIVFGSVGTLASEVLK